MKSLDSRALAPDWRSRRSHQVVLGDETIRPAKWELVLLHATGMLLYDRVGSDGRPFERHGESFRAQVSSRMLSLTPPQEAEWVQWLDETIRHLEVGCLLISIYRPKSQVLP